MQTYRIVDAAHGELWGEVAAVSEAHAVIEARRQGLVDEGDWWVVPNTSPREVRVTTTPPRLAEEDAEARRRLDEAVGWLREIVERGERRGSPNDDAYRRAQAAVLRAVGGHRHRATRKSKEYPYWGPVAVPPHTENPAAHGGIMYYELCPCGAERPVNANGTAAEHGPWGLSREHQRVVNECGHRHSIQVSRARHDP